MYSYWQFKSTTTTQARAGETTGTLKKPAVKNKGDKDK